jgi:hypothetical protein
MAAVAEMKMSQIVANTAFYVSVHFTYFIGLILHKISRFHHF